MLATIERRIAQMYVDRKITVTASGHEAFKPGAREERDRLREKRQALWNRLGPTRIAAGFVHEVWHSRSVYSFTPHLEWRGEYLAATAPDAMWTRPAAKRVVWLLWFFRDRAVIQVAAAPHRVRGPWVECAGCGHQHRYLGRPRDERGVSSCRRCGDLRHRHVAPSLQLRPFGKITKASLRRRFRLSRRELDRILSVPLPADSEDTVQPA